MSKIINKNPNKLNPHPLNLEIYGKEEIDEDFKESIKLEGILQPIVINANDTIISGHRRVVVAKLLKMSDVPCIVKTFLSEDDEELALLSYNKTRVKTFKQEMREIAKYEEHRKKTGLPVSDAITADELNMSKGTFHRKKQVWEAAEKMPVTEADKKEKELAKELVEKIETNPNFTSGKAYDVLVDHRKKEKVRKVREEATKKGGTLEDTDLLYLGDFKTELDFIPDGTVDAFITDPPYPFEFIDCWEELGKFAEKKLRPGGWLVAYSGQKHLPEVYSRLEKSGLKYYWTMALYHNGTRQDVWGVDLNVMWKPIIIYVKPPVLKLDIKQRGDYVVSEKKEKGSHDWQQSTSSVGELITTYSRENDFIVDPFAGSGTTICVAKMMNRKVVGAEIDVDTYNIAKININEMLRINKFI